MKRTLLLHHGHEGVLMLLSLWVLLFTVGCRRDMYDQPRSNPLAASDFFADGSASRSLIPGTIARGQLNADEGFYTGQTGTNLLNHFPMQVTLEILQRGQERFDIYCAVCHGKTGDGRGMIVLRGFPAPPSYHMDRLRQAPPGYFFNVITRGYGVMYSYASRVEPADRWAIAAYIRALQLSQDARIEDVPANERTSLQNISQ